MYGDKFVLKFVPFLSTHTTMSYIQTCMERAGYTVNRRW